MSDKLRLDHLLVERGLADSRARAQAMIEGGRVTSDGAVLDKPSRKVEADLALEIAGPVHPWVSRGGVKLAHALAHFAIDPKDKIALDIGASTGGFTEVLLAGGAARVYAVDVGHDQLVPALRARPEVTVLEKVNARYLNRAQIRRPIDLIVCDASFIGLETLLPAPLALAAPGATLVALIKPQFEVGRSRVGKGGIVREASLHEEVCERIRTWLGAQPGWQVLGLTDSPILGPDGNREFLIAGRLAP